MPHGSSLQVLAAAITEIAHEVGYDAKVEGLMVTETLDEFVIELRFETA